MEIINDIIREWAPKFSLNSGDNLTGFLIDCEYALESGEVCNVLHLESGDDPETLVNAVIEARSGATIQDISHALAAAWQQFAYPEFQAFSIRRYAEATVLRFITASGSGDLCVTGTVIARSPNYDRLVNDFNRDFSSLGGSVKPLPGGLPPWAAG